MNRDLNDAEADDLDRWIDSLLLSDTARQLEMPPSRLVRSFHTLAARPRRRRRYIAGGLVAAAALLVAIGWTLFTNRQAERPGDKRPNNVAVNAAAAEPSPGPSLQGRGSEEPPRARFVGGPDVIAVPVSSRHPNVTIMRVYSAFQPFNTGPQVFDENSASDEVLWSDAHNGG